MGSQYEVESISEELQNSDFELSADKAAERPIIRLVDHIIAEGIQQRASDVHLETVPAGLVIKFRIDGILAQAKVIQDARQAEQAIARVKVMAELDITERRVPQDGRFKALERGRAGLGLGLTLAKQLIDLHGGDIKVFSPGLGLGSRFTVTLPLTEPPAGTMPSPQGADATAPAAAQLPPLDILVADDNVDFAESLTELLRAQGHQVRVVHDGWSALNEAIASPPQVAFFDIGMPGLNGYDLAERLRRHNAGRHIRMIAITGWGQAADRERARQAGFDHHLTKPVSLEQVLGALS